MKRRIARAVPYKYRWRHHWVTLVRWWALALVGLVGLVSLFMSLRAWLPPIWDPKLAIVAIVAVAFLLAHPAYEFLSWRHTYLLLGSKVIIYHEERPVIFIRETTLLLAQVQNVVTAQRGILPQVLGYGSLVVEGTGTAEDIVCHHIPNVRQVRDMILRRARVARRNAPPRGP